MKIVTIATLAALGLMGSGSMAKAITVNIHNLPLSDGGVLNGFFTTGVYGAFLTTVW